MDIKQAYVFRAYFSNEKDAEKAADTLADMAVRCDYIKSRREEPDKWKLIYVEPNWALARLAADKISPLYRQIEYFDPEHHDWWSGFQQYAG